MTMQGIKVRIVVDRKEIMDNLRFLIDLDGLYHPLRVRNRQRMRLDR